MDMIMLTGLTAISLLFTVQAAHTFYLMIYTWDQPANRRGASVPTTLIPPRLSFTTILPARHEEDVIQTTIEGVARMDYPGALVQVLVVCSADDIETINRAREKIDMLRGKGRCDAELVIFEDQPINKPNGLNHALAHASGDVVAVFDAEDEIHPKILSIVNTVMSTDHVHVVQAGVQLMNFDSNWYSTFNVLEYFFWFRSRLHYQARVGAVPLGGNTVFFSRDLLSRLGGWDESNLTEDAEIGLRISGMGETVRVIYDDDYVTKEETPPSLGQFIRQRTRWNQGFMQVLGKGTWRQLPTRSQRMLAVYTLVFPHIQAAFAFYLPMALVMVLFLHAPLVLAMLSWLPVLLLCAHFMLAVIGLREFTEAHGMKTPWSRIPIMALTWFPYQLVLTYAAARALHRHLRGVGNWEKTQHVGAHRTVADAPAMSEAGGGHATT